MYRQFTLKRGDTYRVCWLADDQRLKIGTSLTLKHDDDQQWSVDSKSDVILNHPPDKRWKVGGLS